MIVPQSAGSYLVIDGELILDHATQPPDPVTTDGINQAPTADDQGGIDVQHVIQPDGSGGDPGPGPENDAPRRKGS